jgi:hypothetical protein
MSLSFYHQFREQAIEDSTKIISPIKLNKAAALFAGKMSQKIAWRRPE